jgi:transposase InsO family protein
MRKSSRKHTKEFKQEAIQYSRAVIGWSIQSTMSRQLVCDALMMALRRVVFLVACCFIQTG